MTLIRRTNPFGELISLRAAMGRLFEDSSVRAAKPRQIQIKPQTDGQATQVSQGEQATGDEPTGQASQE